MNTIEKIIVTVHLLIAFTITKYVVQCTTYYTWYIQYLYNCTNTMYVQFEIETHLILFKQLVNKNNINL